MALERELETWRRKFPELLQHEGKFALVHGDEIADVFAAYEDAIQAGYQRFGLQPFLVKQVQSDEQPEVITRTFAPAPQAQCHTSRQV